MIACRRRGAFCKGITCTPARRGPTFVRAKVGKTRSRGTDSPLTSPFLSLAVRIRSQGSRRRICPHRLAVPENIFALLACSIFSTAAGAPPRCIRHWRCSAPPRCIRHWRCSAPPRCIRHWRCSAPHPHPPRPPHPQICIINPSCTSPVKSTIYVISTQHFPIM